MKTNKTIAVDVTKALGDLTKFGVRGTGSVLALFFGGLVVLRDEMLKSDIVIGHTTLGAIATETFGARWKDIVNFDHMTADAITLLKVAKTYVWFFTEYDKLSDAEKAEVDAFKEHAMSTGLSEDKAMAMAMAHFNMM